MFKERELILGLCEKVRNILDSLSRLKGYPQLSGEIMPAQINKRLNIAHHQFEDVRNNLNDENHFGKISNGKSNEISKKCWDSIVAINDFERNITKEKYKLDHHFDNFMIVLFKIYKDLVKIQESN